MLSPAFFVLWNIAADRNPHHSLSLVFPFRVNQQPQVAAYESRPLLARLDWIHEALSGEGLFEKVEAATIESKAAGIFQP